MKTPASCVPIALAKLPTPQPALPGEDIRTIRRRRSAGMSLLTSILVVFGIAVTDAMADSPTRVIQTTSGPVRGVSNGVVNEFQGIRYANSTAGANRWTPLGSAVDTPSFPTPAVDDGRQA